MKRFIFKRVLAFIVAVLTFAGTLHIFSFTAIASGTSYNPTEMFKPFYFNDTYFVQMNTVVFADSDLYKENNIQDKQSVSSYASTESTTSADYSHISKGYIAPILDNGYSYMNKYDYTYCWSNDSQVASYMSLVSADSKIWDKANSTTEYNELVKTYDTYKSSNTYDVNTYVDHYIIVALNDAYGKYLFDCDYYMKKYPALSFLYDYDETALMYHFYTIGMYEGRQGCKDFNVHAYMRTNYSTTSDYKNSTNLAKYYIKYAESRYAGTSSKTYNKNSSDPLQLRLYDPSFDAYFETVNYYRNKEGLSDYKEVDIFTQGELNALANYRCRYDVLNADSYAHNYAQTVGKTFYNKGIINSNTWHNGYGENKALLKYSTSKYGVSNVLNHASDLRSNESMYFWKLCDSHYTAATQNSAYVATAQSHIYVNECFTSGGTNIDPEKVGTVVDQNYGIVFTLYFKSTDIF